MPDTLKERLRSDLNEARRGRDRFLISLLTMTISETRNREIELGREAGDADVIEVVGRAIKQRREAAEQMRGGGRADLAEKEEREAAALAVYLPPQMAESEVRTMVREAIAGGATSIGALMGAIMPRIKGQFDGREANRIAREELS